MISSAIIPQPLARLPWRLIFLVLGIGLFGLINLYSAAGGSITPWALRQGKIPPTGTTLHPIPLRWN